jgi:hypothetical protein
VIRKTGFEMSVGGEIVRSDPVVWTMSLGLAGYRNKVLSLGPGVRPFNLPNGGALSRVEAGYPLMGVWARPVISYADANGDGALSREEVQIGDSLAYMGSSEPDYTASLFTGVSLFRGTLRVDAGFNYQHGMTQVNGTFNQRSSALRPLNDPEANPAEIAGMLVLRDTPYAAIQDVSLLRVNSLTVSYALPVTLAQAMGARAGAISLQGTNLALFSNYRGTDPNVNAFPTGNGVFDSGQLPEPRSWQVRVNLQY